MAALGIAAITALLAVATATTGSVAKLNDFYIEAWPAYHALIHGHIFQSIRLGPAYVGSLVLRAPFAVIPSLWGGGAREIYFASAMPCLIAAPLFGVWLAADQQRHTGTVNPIWPIVLCVLNPIVIVALFLGHPEEVLTAVLAVVGVVLAVRGRAAFAGFLIGLAIINISWALVAAPVALAVMTVGRRRGLLVMVATAAVVLVPVTVIRLEGTGNGPVSAQLGTGIGTIFTSPQLLWWFGRGSWLAAHARFGIVLAAVACAALWWARQQRAALPARLDEALLLLALVLLLRAALDPWDNTYYHVPFLFALLAYETHTRRWPVLTLLYSVLLVVVAPANGVAHLGGNLQAAAYAVLVVPAILWMAAKLFLTPAERSRLLSVA